MLTGQEVSRTCPSHNVLEMLLLLQLLFKEPFAAVLTAEGTSRYWRQMVFFSPSYSPVSHSEPSIWKTAGSQWARKYGKCSFQASTLSDGGECLKEWQITGMASLL